MRNRPVLTSAVHDDDGYGRMHLDVLGAAPSTRKYFYRDKASLRRLLLDFRRLPRTDDLNAYRAFEPAKVMAIFERVFLGAPPVTSHGSTEDGMARGGAAGADDGVEAVWVEACASGTLTLEKVCTLALPGARAIFLSSCRRPQPAGKTTASTPLPPTQQGCAPSMQHGEQRELLHVFREDALATFRASSICLATSCGLLRQAASGLSQPRRLSSGEDPRIFTHGGRIFVVDNTLDHCRLLCVGDDKGRGTALTREYRVALSGKNLTFLPSDDGSELLLVHWFSPLKVFRVTLPTKAVGADDLSSPALDTFAQLECVYAADGEVQIGSTGTAGQPRADEFRGGTPGRPTGQNTWWGLLHRTHQVGPRLVHDPWAWVVRRRATGAYDVRMTEVAVHGRDAQSHIFDPCSIVQCGHFDGLAVTTAESATGWFEEQAFRTCMYRLSVARAPCL